MVIFLNFFITQITHNLYYVYIYFLLKHKDIHSTLPTNISFLLNINDAFQLIYILVELIYFIILLIDHLGVYEMPNIYEDMPPNPRSLSINLVKDEDSPDNTKTMMMAYWAIFIGHDLSHTVVSSMGKHI